MTSATPAASSLPITLARSMTISMCRPFCARNTDVGAAASPRVADEFGGVLQAGLGAVLQGDDERAVLHRIAGRIGMRALRQRRVLVEKLARPGDHLRAARGIVAGLGVFTAGQRVRAVERVVERAPARVGGVERIARVHHRHDELRAGEARDLVIDALGSDREIGAGRHEIADLGQEGLVFGGVERLALAREMPGVDLRLQLVALGEQRLVARREVDQIFSRPSQNAFGARPVPGRASLSTNLCRTSAISIAPWRT